ncbi:MAG: hypothetical protein C0594_00530 [Marinilabiliales bacterium]|nr:MAG: hypothetical protein C0594_00530 [Marinilabiliales bacterium]
MEEQRVTVFISYSWDSQEHREWVLNLANDLISTYGLNVILDQYELSAGKELTYFMESSIEEADKVLIILTPEYKRKAESRSSGVGYETSMISQEVFESSIAKIKFIPVLRKGTSSCSTPKFLKSKLFHSMIDDNIYANSLYELSRILYEKPLLEKPNQGPIPDFKGESPDPIIDIANSVIEEERKNNEIDYFLDSTSGVQMFEAEIQILINRVKEKSEFYKKNTAIHFSFENNNHDFSVLSAHNYSVSFYWRKQYSNSTKDSKFVVRYLKGYIRTDNRTLMYFPGEEPVNIKEFHYSFDLDYNKNVKWKYNGGIVSTDEIIKQSFLFIIEEIRKEKSKGFRG